MSLIIEDPPTGEGLWLYVCDGYIDSGWACIGTEGWADANSLLIQYEGMSQSNFESLVAVSVLVLAVAAIFKIARKMLI